ncbi:Uncharacterised protein r2_g585 [Pycnogonum litorale]
MGDHLTDAGLDCTWHNLFSTVKDRVGCYSSNITEVQILQSAITERRLLFRCNRRIEPALKWSARIGFAYLKIANSKPHILKSILGSLNFTSSRIPTMHSCCYPSFGRTFFYNNTMEGKVFDCKRIRSLLTKTNQHKC